jgi:hypothetical protein
MNFSALRRNLLVGSLGLALSAGLLGQAVAGEQLQNQRRWRDQRRLEGTYPPFSFVDADGKLPASKSSSPKPWPRAGCEGETATDQVGRHPRSAGIQASDVVINQ